MTNCVSVDSTYGSQTCNSCSEPAKLTIDGEPYCISHFVTTLDSLYYISEYNPECNHCTNIAEYCESCSTDNSTCTSCGTDYDVSVLCSDCSGTTCSDCEDRAQYCESCSTKCESCGETGISDLWCKDCRDEQVSDVATQVGVSVEVDGSAVQIGDITFEFLN